MTRFAEFMENYQSSQRSNCSPPAGGDLPALLEAAKASLARNVVYISTFWEDGQTRTSGRETIRVFISKPLDELIKPSQDRYAHKLGRFRRHGSDHVVDGYRPDSASAALARACGAARVLQFMDITGLQPSKAHVEPGAEYLARLPGRDHGSAWYDPVAKHHVGADEPYARSVTSKVAERAPTDGVGIRCFQPPATATRS
ncbi:hypothetical protein NKJ84_28130 [Mesorhizobium sp. M0048]|uniref:hypothetical protein n=1 Tax=Mesorhizobium sp. M0048 TaxID=2956860 RepID=UPI003336AF64